MNFETINDNSISSKAFDLYHEYKKNCEIIENHKQKLLKNLEIIKKYHEQAKDLLNKEKLAAKIIDTAKKEDDSTVTKQDNTKEIKQEESSNQLKSSEKKTTKKTSKTKTKTIKKKETIEKSKE